MKFIRIVQKYHTNYRTELMISNGWQEFLINPGKIQQPSLPASTLLYSLDLAFALTTIKGT